MSLVEYMEDRRSFYVYTCLMLAVAILAATILRDPVSFDMFWHLKMGEDFVRNGISPYVDHYSFTFAGETITTPPVLFQSLLYLLVDTLGPAAGFNTYKLICALSTLGLFAALLKTLKSPAIIYWIAIPLLVMVLQWRAIVRPELLSYPLIIISFFLYHRAYSELNWRTVWPIALLMFIWSNHHSGILGYIIFFGLFLDHGLRLLYHKSNVKDWTQVIGWGLVIMAVGFLNPELSHPAINTLMMSPEWKSLIYEYRSSDSYLRIIGTYALIAVTALTVLLLVKRKHWGLLFVCLLMAWSAATTIRLVTPASLMVLSSFAIASAGISMFASSMPGNRRLAHLPAILVVFSVIALGQSIHNARQFIKSNQVAALRYPEATVTYLKNSGLQGNILNNYALGGFLIKNLAPDFKVYIDGRTNILYPLEHLNRYLEIEKYSAALSEELDAYNVDFILFPNGAHFSYLISRTDQYELDFPDIGYSLYRRKGEGNFPNSGWSMVHSYCWDEDIEAAVRTEAELVSDLSPELSYLPQWHNEAIGYLSNLDKTSWIEQRADSDEFADPALRFIGYRALDLELWNTAHDTLRKISQRVLKDELAIALALIRQGEMTAAEDVIYMAIRSRWLNPEPSDIILLWSLLLEIERERPLQKVSPTIIEQMASEAETYQLSGPIHSVQAADFCRLAIK